MDKRFLESHGITLGLKRWEAWLVFASLSVIGAGMIWLGVVIFLGFFAN